MGLGNHWMTFEMLTNLVNEMYQRGGVALINKCQTPVKVSVCWVGSMKLKSTVDYDGVYKGRAIEFEAKSTGNVTRFSII